MSFSFFGSIAKAFSGASHHPTFLEEEKKKFFHAMQKDDMYAMDEIIERHPDYKTWRTDDGSVLQSAQAWGSFEAFVELMGRGADKNEDYGQGWTPVLTALAKGDGTFLEYILEHNPDLNGRATDKHGRSYTALQLAIDSGDGPIVRALIERGADATVPIELKDGSKASPEEYATHKKYPKIAEMLKLAPEIRAIHAHTYKSFLDEQVTTEEAALAVSAPAVRPATPPAGP